MFKVVVNIVIGTLAARSSAVLLAIYVYTHRRTIALLVYI
jgi:hypothetical protein